MSMFTDDCTSQRIDYEQRSACNEDSTMSGLSSAALIVVKFETTPGKTRLIYACMSSLVFLSFSLEATSSQMLLASVLEALG